MGKWDHSIVLYLLNLSRPPSGLRSPCSCPPPHDQVVLVRAKAWESWNKKVTGSLPAGAFVTWNSVAASGAGALRYSAKGAKSSLAKAHEAKQARRRSSFFCSCVFPTSVRRTDNSSKSFSYAVNPHVSGHMVDHVTLTQNTYRHRLLVLWGAFIYLFFLLI